MRAILPGRPQSKRQALCTAHWDGLRLVAYISGNAAVILSGPQTILQTIYVDTVDALIAITLDESTGRIALCDADHVYIYRPVGREEGVLRWTQIHELRHPQEIEVSSLSWGSSDELLVGGSRLILWFAPESTTPLIVWDQALAYPTALAYLAPDSSFVASVGCHDRLVKIWRRLSYEADGTRFDVSYLPHPAAVTNLHWRKPWHLEQNLDNLLYTFCSDNCVRAWTAFDGPHGLSFLQQVGAIDMNASIQPRRLSVGSMSTRRFAFVIDSRDFSTATEKAVQGSSTSTKAADTHALEHLIEIANRSPEICVVLDGLGHMSVWGLENAGYKNRIPPSVFHISHVDGMNIHVPQMADPLEDYVQFCIFAGGSTGASLSLLLHSFAGDIDWYDSQITHLFDTSIRHDRARLISSLAGHAAPVQRIVRNVVGTILLSATDEGQASIWQHESSTQSLKTTAPLLRRSSFAVEADVRDAVILSRGRYAAILSSRGLELWDVRQAKARRLATQTFAQNRIPLRISQSRIASERALTSRVILGYDLDHNVQAWELLLPAEDKERRRSGATKNGYHELIRPLGEVTLHAQNRYSPLVSICDNMSTVQNGSHPQLRGNNNSLNFAFALAKDGTLEMIKSQEEPDSTKPRLVSGALVETNIRSPKAISANGYGKIVVVNDDSSSLSIWDTRTGAWEYDHELDGTDTIKTFAWAVSPQGSAVVAVCFDYHIVVLGQVRYAYSNPEPAWVDLQHIRIRDFTTHAVGDLCWLGSGDLVVGTGIQFFVFRGYASTHHNQHAKAILGVQEKIHTDATFEVMSMLNALLPLFHPTVISLLAYSSGSIKATKDVICRLHQELKFFSEGDELCSFLDTDINSITKEGTTTESRRRLSYGTQSNMNGTSELEPISSFSENLKEHLLKQRLWQITHDEQMRLAEQVEVAVELEKQESSVDENGMRFLQALYLSGGDAEVPWSAISFAALSASQEVLVDLVTRYYGGKLTWAAAQKSGLFSWLSDLGGLRQQMENVGRAEFTAQEDRNPVECSLYYLALGKKAVLRGLWRMAIGVREKENTMKLLANDFSEKRWRATALKNAYALLSKRRFHYAAAFFLLGGSLWDAVNVCVHQLEDLQLAIAIARVYQSDDQGQPPSTATALTRLVEEVVLPQAVDSVQGRWMASWAYTMGLERRDLAVQAVVLPLHKVTGQSLVGGKMAGSLNYAANDPLLATLYTQLRASLASKDEWRDVVSTRDEWNFVMRCVRQYLRMGCDVLALALVREWEFVAESDDPDAARPTTEPVPGLQRRKTFFDLEKEEEAEGVPISKANKKKPPPTQFEEPSANSLLDSFGF